jgi:NitT/TauT family transport system substrate-binding protein
MQRLNRTMDPRVFAEGAEAQKPLIVTAEMTPQQIGMMTQPRCEELIGQLQELGIIEQNITAAECFRPVPWQ